jgi:preprotein translocase subunit SecD
MAITHKHLNRYLYFIAVLALTALFTTSLSAAELSGNQPRTFRFEVRLASLEKVEGWESVPGPHSGNIIWISPEATLTNADVNQASPGRTSDDKLCVNLLLTEDGALKLARLTKSHIGAFVAEMMDGRVYALPRIAAEITGPQARLDGNFTEEEAKAIADGITPR